MKMDFKKAGIIICATWIISFAILLITSDGDFLAAAVMASVFAVVVALIILIAILDSATNGAASTALNQTKQRSIYRGPQNTGMISCRNCGYMGAGHLNYCPKCNSTKIEKITTETQIISCQKCGYFGAGTSHCPRCGSGLIEKVFNNR